MVQLNNDGGATFVSNQLYLWRDRLNHRATAIGSLAIALICFAGAAGVKQPIHKFLLMSSVTVAASVSLRSSKAHRFADVMVTGLERVALGGWQQNAVQALMPTTKRGNDAPLQMEAEVVHDEEWLAIMQLEDPTAKALLLSLDALGIVAHLISIEQLEDCDRYIVSVDVPFTKVQRIAKDLAAKAGIEEVRVSAVGRNVALDVPVVVDYAEPDSVSVDVPVGDAVAVESKVKVESDRLPDGARLIEMTALNDMDRYPVIMIPGSQGSGKTATMAAIGTALDGLFVVASPKPLSSAMQSTADLIFGFDTRRSRWLHFGKFNDSMFGEGLDVAHWLNAGKVAGSMLDFVWACRRESSNRQLDPRRARTPINAFFDEAAWTYLSGYSDPLEDGTGKLEKKAQVMISSCNKDAFMNYRAQRIRMFFGTQNDNVGSIGLENFAKLKNDSWTLYPGLSAITAAQKAEKYQLANWFQSRVESGLGVALLTKENSIFEAINMPDLVTLKKFSTDEEA